MVPGRIRLDIFCICYWSARLSIRWTVSVENPEVKVIEKEVKELSFGEILQAKLNQILDEIVTASKKLYFQAIVKKEINFFQSGRNVKQNYIILQSL